MVETGQDETPTIPANTQMLEGKEDAPIEKEKTKPISVTPRKLSLWIKLSFAFPTFSMLPVVVFISVYSVPYYEILGTPVAYMGFFIALARGFDVFTDPLMSFVTDSFRSKYGRRRPFIMIGSIIYSVCLLFFFYPPIMSPLSMAVWFGFFYILFFLSNTFMTIPYDALGPELTDDYKDRSSLYFYSGIIDALGSFLAAVAPTALIMLAEKTPEHQAMCDRDKWCMQGRSCDKLLSTGEYATYYIPNVTDAKAAAANFTNQCIAQTTPYIGEVAGFCNCLDQCSTSCSLAGQRNVYVIVALFYGIFLISSVTNLWVFIKERNQLKGSDQSAYKELQKSEPLVPAIYNTMRNRAFTILLPAWVCDSVVNAIIQTLLLFYTRYVVQPEYQTLEEHGIDCNNGIPIPGTDSTSWKCNSQTVASYGIVGLLTAAFLGTPFWLFMAKKFGKYRAWLLWSFTMAFTNAAFLIPGPGDVYALIFIAALNGLPFGAKFLADAVLADVIDYDEFLTGSRTEAMYFMFRSFLPKMSAIPASAIPLSLMAALGFVPSEQGRIMKQPKIIYYYLKIMGGGVTMVGSLLAFYFKYQFPFQTRRQVRQISVALHEQEKGLKAADPLSQELYIPFSRNPETARKLSKNFEDKGSSDKLTEQLFLLSHFPGPKFTKKEELEKTIKELKCRLVAWGVIVLALLISVYWTFSLLTSRKFEWVPIFNITGFGFMITVIAWDYFRLRAAKALLVNDWEPQLQDLIEEDNTERERLKKVPINRLFEFRSSANDEKKKEFKNFNARYVRMSWFLEMGSGIKNDYKKPIQVEFFSDEGKSENQKMEFKNAEAKALSSEKGLDVDYQTEELNVEGDFGGEKNICGFQTNTPVPFILFYRNKEEESWMPYFVNKKDNNDTDNDDQSHGDSTNENKNNSNRNSDEVPVNNDPSVTLHA